MRDNCYFGCGGGPGGGRVYTHRATCPIVDLSLPDYHWAVKYTEGTLRLERAENYVFGTDFKVTTEPEDLPKATKRVAVKYGTDLSHWVDAFQYGTFAKGTKP